MISSLFKKVARPLVFIALICAILLVWPLFVYAETNGTEKVYYFLNDHLGNVDVVLDEEGNVVERADYLPYGNDRLRLDADGDGKDNDDHKFTGKEKDDETGLMFYGARYYDSAIGRFVSYDPMLLDEGSKPLTANLQNPQALNPYTYALNNPVRYTDETGEYQKDVHYDLTLFLSLVAGFNEDQAGTIAFRDQFMDDNPKTEPGGWNYLWHKDVILKYHYADKKDAIERLEEAIENKSLEAFGDALHTFQDTFSHGGLTPEEHIKLMNTPDQTYRQENTAKAVTMARASFFQLRKANLETNGSGELTKDQYIKHTTQLWNVFRPEIENYLRLEDKKDTNIHEVARIVEKKSKK